MQIRYKRPSVFRESIWASNTPTTRVWWDRKGKTHRYHGPAVEYSSGVKSWFSHGCRVSTETGDTTKEVGKVLLIEELLRQ